MSDYFRNKKQDDLFASLPKGASLRYKGMILPEGRIVVTTLTAPEGMVWTYNKRPVIRSVFEHDEFYSQWSPALFERLQRYVDLGIEECDELERVGAPLPF